MVDETDNIFRIHSSQHCGTLEFVDVLRDRQGEVEQFSVWLTDENLRAGVRVYTAGTMCLAAYFENLAKHWAGWDGVKAWAPWERRLVLKSTNDGRGHISIAVTLYRMWHPRDWTVQGTIFTDAGLLDRIASDCRSFLKG